MNVRSPLIVGTRGSKLALAQTDMVRAELAAIRPDLHVEAMRISTKGDRIQDRPLAEVGGKALFVLEIETALREGRIHLAVHSAKDIPSDLPDDMRIAACLPRADARDALVSRVSNDIASLPAGARVGTSSPRRACQLRAMRPDLDLRDIRGNVDTRLAKLEAGDFDAIILAAAGLSRLGLLHHVTQFVPLEQMLPCAAQGAIAIEVCSEDEATIALVNRLDHAPTSTAVIAERAFLARIGGSCNTPLAAHARVDGNSMVITGMIGDASGKTVSATLRGDIWDAAAIGVKLAEQLMAAGGEELLKNDPEYAAISGARTHG
ncbi:MAG: hydroxymethylbilane synthase [Gemmatimonadaceae bacterium]